jgi:uncharacterized protein YdaU (DUF1376 family)
MTNQFFFGIRSKKINLEFAARKKESKASRAGKGRAKSEQRAGKERAKRAHAAPPTLKGSQSPFNFITKFE